MIMNINIEMSNYCGKVISNCKIFDNINVLQSYKLNIYKK